MSDMCSFNVHDGYAEGVVRSLRKGILSESTYTILKSTHNLKDFKAVIKYFLNTLGSYGN